MRFPLTLSLLLLNVAAACAAPLIPIEDFAQPAAFSNLTLSPDGKYYASLRSVRGRDNIVFSDVATFKPLAFDLGQADILPSDREVYRYHWLGSKRVLLVLSVRNLIEGTVALNRDGTRWKPLTGLTSYGGGIRVNFEQIHAYEMIHSFDDDVNVLMLDQRTGRGQEELLYPHVIKLDSEEGSFDRVVTNPGHVTDWLADTQGIVRLGLERKNDELTLLYRSNEKSAWRPLNNLPIANVALESFTADGSGIFISMANKERFLTFYCVDPEKETRGEPLLELPGYDVQFSYSGDKAGSIWSRKKRTIVAFRYVTERPAVKYFDDQLAAQMASIDQLLPKTVNVPVNFSADDSLILIKSSSDREAGAYYLFDTIKNKLSPVAKVQPALKTEQMVAMYPIKYNARDGLEIHGYLSIPSGKKPLGLPLIVMPHGGPWVRDIWGFDPMVQMLANRGYAVLQMNYRGSAGYGRTFSDKGSKEVGGAIQTDIEDATRWAIEKKIADPKRIAIMGSSYGGYSALYALGKSPGLYRCGISICGVTDWLSLYKKLNDPEDIFAREHWIREIGDPDQDETKLKAISPIYFAEAITAPLLIIQGKKDQIVPPNQAKSMIAALEKSGRKPESLFIPDEGHGFFTVQGRLAEFKAVETFLAKHMPVDVEAPVPTAP